MPWFINTPPPSMVQVPLLSGALEAVERGITSSLQPQNLRVRRAIADGAAARDRPAYPLLFDPQTAGGLLAGVPADAADACVTRLREQGYFETAVIGEVIAVEEPETPIRLRP